MNAVAEPKRPRLWKYLLIAALLLVILIPAWTLFVMLVIEPQPLMQEPTMAKQLMWFVAAPVLVVFGVVGGSWQTAAAQSPQTPAAPSVRVASQAPAVAASEQAKREYVLEVISLGVTVDKYRQGKLWEALGKGHPTATIREQDSKKYPWSADEKEGQEGGRVNDALENGAKFTPTYWGIPSFYAGSPAFKDKVSPISPATVIGSPSTSGLAWNLFIAAGWELSERPDRLLEKVFAFFDANPDVPCVVLSSADGLYFRNLYRPKGTPPLIKDGNYIPALQTLPEAERKDAPARVIEATAGNTDQTIALTSVFSAWAEQGGPEVDRGKPTQWINTDARLGNTGAATWFMQMAIGVMGSYREGGTSAAINLRDPAEASIILITPPPEAKRKAQHTRKAAMCSGTTPRRPAIRPTTSRSEPTMPKIILLGDPTDHGGCTLTEGDPHDTYHGIPVAYEGHLVSCGARLMATVANCSKS